MIFEGSPWDEEIICSQSEMKDIQLPLDFPPSLGRFSIHPGFSPEDAKTRKREGRQKTKSDQNEIGTALSHASPVHTHPFPFASSSEPDHLQYFREIGYPTAFPPEGMKNPRNSDRFSGYFPTTPAVGSSRMGVKMAVRWPLDGS